MLYTCMVSKKKKCVYIYNMRYKVLQFPANSVQNVR